MTIIVLFLFATQSCTKEAEVGTSTANPPKNLRVGFSFTGKVVEMANPLNSFTDATISYTNIDNLDPVASSNTISATGKFGLALESSKLPSMIIVKPNSGSNKSSALYYYSSPNTSFKNKFTFEVPTLGAITSPTLAISVLKTSDQSPVVGKSVKVLNSRTGITTTLASTDLNGFTKIDGFQLGDSLTITVQDVGTANPYTIATRTTYPTNSYISTYAFVTP